MSSFEDLQHRRLTRRAIEAFPEDALFQYSKGYVYLRSLGVEPPPFYKRS